MRAAQSPRPSCGGRIRTCRGFRAALTVRSATSYGLHHNHNLRSTTAPPRVERGPAGSKPAARPGAPWGIQVSLDRQKNPRQSRRALGVSMPCQDSNLEPSRSERDALPVAPRGSLMRDAGIEPAIQRWHGRVIPLHQSRVSHRFGRRASGRLDGRRRPESAPSFAAPSI
jgi:hypothetical protein